LSPDARKHYEALLALETHSPSEEGG
jgi:hypothetical protein